MDAEQIISMRQVCKGYNMGSEHLNVLKNIDFTVNKGEFTAILGPSGSGKSTLMNIIGCMDTLDSGSYELNGIPIHKTKESKLTKIRNHEIGFIFQNYHLIPTYTVMQNIIMPLLMRGQDRKSAERECQETVEMLGLSQRLDHRPSELSGGQRQRVAIARALCSKPSLLLADEPTGALDQNSGTEVLKLFTKLHEMGNTIVMITHDLNVANWAQRTVRIVDGNISE
jgi:putative ABC transport system ATP-binding protein